MNRRIQCDEQWQRDFFRLITITLERDEHVYAARQLFEAGAHDAARDELDLADEDNELIACLEHALVYLDDRPC